MMIMLVEDNDVVADLFKDIIQDMGYSCLHVISAEQAFKEIGPVLARLKLIIMDFKLVDMTGIRATIKLRTTISSLHDLPIIGITGGLYTDDVELLEQAQFNLILQKPILPRQLRLAIEICLGPVEKAAP